MNKKLLLNKTSDLLAALLMLFFAIPKLIGAEKSVKGFEQFQSLIPIDPNIFRIFTGSVELIIALLLIFFTINNNKNIGKVAYFLLLSTMIGGLIMEFFARPEPAMMLVIIAILLSILSFFKLKSILKK